MKSPYNCIMYVCLLLGSGFDDRIHMCGIHLHLCRSYFLFKFSTAKELHRRCTLCDIVLFIELLLLKLVFYIAYNNNNNNNIVICKANKVSSKAGSR